MPTLEVTTVASCTVRCTFCPQDTLKAAYPKASAHRLVPDAFRKCLSKVPPYVRIDFSGFVEPWLNPDCTEMLAEAIARGFSVAVYTTLQGMKDPEAVVELLMEHAPQVEVLCLHLPDAHGHMTGLHVDREWRTALELFLELRKLGVIRRFETMTMSDTGEPMALLAVERLLPWVGMDRAGTLDRGRVEPRGVEQSVTHQQAVGCSFTPFYDQNVLLPNGDVVLCCMDYGLRHVLGNLLRQEYHELFSGAEMGRLRAANMRPGNTDRSICTRCTRATRYRAPEGARQMWAEER